MTIALWIIAALLVLVGLAGIVLPALPGAVLVFLGLLMGAWIDDFQRVGWITIVVLGCMTVLALALDVLASSLGVYRSGASKQAVTGSVLGAIAGIFFGLPGIVFGPFLGAVIGEFMVRRDALHAGRAGFGTWLGMVLGTAVKLALVLAMVGIFLLVYVQSV